LWCQAREREKVEVNANRKDLHVQMARIPHVRIHRSQMIALGHQHAKMEVNHFVKMVPVRSHQMQPQTMIAKMEGI
jgi:hypothetical protein